MTDESSARAIAEDSRRSPEVALSYAVASATPSRGPSRSASPSSPSAQKPIDALPRAVDATSARWRGRGRLTSQKYADSLVDLHRSTEGSCLASCSGLVPYLPPIPWGAPATRVEATEASATPGPAAAAPPPPARGSKRARNSE